MYNWEAKYTQLWFYIIRLKCSHFRKKKTQIAIMKNLLHTQP